MKVVFTDRQKMHQPAHIVSSGALIANPEVPVRAEHLLRAALSCGLELDTPVDYGLAPLGAVHTAGYLHFLEHIFPRWQRIPDASADVFPNIHPDSRDCVYPKSAVGQVGFHVFDGAAPITADTWMSARWSANSAVHAAEHILQGEKVCYALARPPGHHATRDQAGGFCYLNNTAVAAQHLRTKYARVAIIDVDVHHGNGTQNIFYARDDVLTVSIHADPIRFYPFFWGSADETGVDAGEGFNVNRPLPRGTDDESYLNELNQVLEKVNHFDPQAIVVALGLDAFAGDPFAGFAISTEGFGRISQCIAALNKPTVLVQEGGYLCDQLGDNLQSFLQVFAQDSLRGLSQDHSS